MGWIALAGNGDLERIGRQMGFRVERRHRVREAGRRIVEGVNALIDFVLAIRREELPADLSERKSEPANFAGETADPVAEGIAERIDRRKAPGRLNGMENSAHRQLEIEV